MISATDHSDTKERTDILGNINSSSGLRGLVSVIIPVKDSARTLGRCLESIHSQTYPLVEILVVDGYSSDNTRAIATEHGATVLLLDSERHKAKNFGISQANGEFVVFIDSDMILEKDVIKECVGAMCDASVGGLIIPEHSIGHGFWVKIRDFERSLYAGTRIESARFFRKTLVLQVGGFDEKMVFYEESTLHQRVESLGITVNRRITSYILHDEDEFQLKRWLQKKRYYSDTSKIYLGQYSYAESQTSIKYRLRALTGNGKWKIMLKHPILTMGVFILKGLEYLASKT